METLNSYYGMGVNDYRYAKGGMQTCRKIGNYNGVAGTCAQSAEKLLKSVIDKEFADDADALKLLHSHNLRALYNKVITKHKLEITSKDCKWLGDFYFDARYPGDDFIVVNEDDANECLRLVEIIKEDVDRILKEHENNNKERLDSIERLKAF